MTHGGFENQPPIIVAFVASVISGAIVVSIETPLDLANTRLFNQGKFRQQLRVSLKAVINYYLRPVLSA